MSEPRMTDDCVPRPTRRQIVAWGSLAAAAPLVPSWAWAQESLAEEAAAPAQPLSVGYVLGSADIPFPRILAWRSLRGQAARTGPDAVVVPAASLPSGDPNFEVRGLRLWLNGLYPGSLRADQLPRSIELDQVTWTRDRATGQRARYFAWSFRRDPAPQGSSPVRFNAAVGPTQPLELAMRVLPAHGGRVQRLRARFTLGMQSGLPRLERGVYFLGVVPGAFHQETFLPRSDETSRPELLSLVLAVEPAHRE